MSLKFRNDFIFKFEVSFEFVLTCFFVICAFAPFRATAEVVEASLSPCPSQVLVIYNADWQERHPLITSSQDSLAVAEHYVRMHTDPSTGEKPYLLGLSAKSLLGSSALAKEHFEEKSRDNSCGVVYQAEDSGKLVSACEMRDGRLVELVLPKSEVEWDISSLRLELEPARRSDPARILVVENGLSKYPNLVQVRSEGEWNIRALGNFFITGDFFAKAQCKNTMGELHEWAAEYHDIRKAMFSVTGLDNVRDDQDYLDLVEQPIKDFLEDPNNARPDGTLLKDHILFFVICYGLPKTVTAPFGIAVGITEKHNNYGVNIDFGQRLQLMFYDLDDIDRNMIQLQRVRYDKHYKSNPSPFTCYLFRTQLSRAFYGSEFNPFIHILAYSNSKIISHDPPRFIPEHRKIRPDRHLFFAMRIDGSNALESLELIDRSVYASRFAGPNMGVLPEISLTQSSDRAGNFTAQSLAQNIWDLGYRHFSVQPQNFARIEFLKLAPGLGFLNEDNVFLPGGVATYVNSNDGWNIKKSRFYSYLLQGVTITAGSAWVAPGKSPHIHSHSFWDEHLLYHYLFKGYPMGEILLMNQVHMGWITSFVGDPLYRLPVTPDQPPSLLGLSWEHNVRITPGKIPDLGRGYFIVADLETSASVPRVAQMRLRYDGLDKDYVFERFAAKPYVFVTSQDAKKSDKWQMELMDPFGQRVNLEGEID